MKALAKQLHEDPSISPSWLRTGGPPIPAQPFVAAEEIKDKEAFQRALDEVWIRLIAMEASAYARNPRNDPIADGLNGALSGLDLVRTELGLS